MSFYFSNSNTQFNRLHGNCSYFLMLFCFKYKLAYMAVWYRPREREVTEVWRAEQHGAHGAHGAVQFNIKLAHVLLFVCFLHLHLIQTLLDFSLIHSIARAREFEISKAKRTYLKLQNAVGEHARIVVFFFVLRSLVCGSRAAESFNLFVMHFDCRRPLAITRWKSWDSRNCWKFISSDLELRLVHLPKTRSRSVEKKMKVAQFYTQSHDWSQLSNTLSFSRRERSRERRKGRKKKSFSSSCPLFSVLICPEKRKRGKVEIE